MENCFISTYVRNKERIKDLFRWYVYGRRWVIAVHSVLGAALILNSVCAIFDRSISMLITNVILLAVVELLRLRNYQTAVKLTLQRDLESNQGQPVQLTVTVRDDIIHVEDASGQGHDVPLSQMKWAVKTKKMVVIRTKAKVLFQLPNDTFTQGTPEGLIAYLRAKGIGS